MEYKLQEFDRKMDPLIAEAWMRKVEKILNTLMIIDDANRIRLATHQLESEVDQWWRDKQDTINTTGFMWQGFRDLFFDKYYPPTE